MLIDTWKGYKFYFRSEGVVVMRGNKYIDFFDTLEDAYEFVE